MRNNHKALKASTPPTETTSQGLARAMFEELDMLRNGTSTPQQARAKAAIANSLIAISRLEMDFARFIADPRGDDETHGTRALTLG